MIRGIIALFTSGAILNPMILLGIILGFVFALTLPMEMIFEIFGDARYYALVCLISFIYNALFKKVYKEKGYDLDWKEMSGNTVLSALFLFLANSLSVSFVYLMSFF